jgi:hypothetical protein
MFQPTRPSLGAFKFREAAVPSMLLWLVFFMFVMFLNEVNVVPRMPHVLFFFFWYACCLSNVQCGCYS